MDNQLRDLEVLRNCVWHAVGTAAEQLGFIRLKLPLKKGDNAHRTLTWQRNGNDAESPEVLKMKIPIREIKAGPGCSLEVDVNVNGSLESVGRRTALFSRLLDEHNIAALPRNGNRTISGQKSQSATKL